MQKSSSQIVYIQTKGGTYGTAKDQLDMDFFLAISYKILADQGCSSAQQHWAKATSTLKSTYWVEGSSL